MSLRARILWAGVVALLMATGVGLYLQWPHWYGTEILLPVNVTSNLDRDGHVFVEYPDAKIKIDAPNVMPEANHQAGGYMPIRTVGVVWDPRLTPDQQTAQIRNQWFFLQLKPSATMASDGRPIWHPVSISDAPIREAVNMRVRVVGADRAGELDLELGPNRIPMASRPATNQAVVVITVLPSGRHALVNSLTR